MRYLSALTGLLLFIYVQTIYSFDPRQRLTNELIEIQKAYKSQNFELVIQKGEPYVNNTPNDVDAYLYVALSYYQLKQFKAAENFFKSLLKIQPDNLEAIVGLIRTQIALKDYNQALISLNSGFDYFPKDAALLYYKKELSTLKQTQKTEAIIEESNNALSSIAPIPKLNEKNQASFPHLSESLEQESKAIKDILGLKEIKNLYKKRKYETVLIEANKYLELYPKDPDIRLFLALSYKKLAEQNFKMILKKYPHYQEAQEGLRHCPPKKIKPFKKEKKYRLKMQRPSYLSYHQPKLSKKFVEKDLALLSNIPHWEVVANSLNAKVHNPNQIWDWSSFFIIRKNKYGSFTGGVNYASRLGHRNSQGIIDLQPVLSKNTWLDLTYSGANDPYLFPNVALRAELFNLITKHLQISLGNDYRKILGNTYFNTLLGSVGFYTGNYFFNFIPKHYVPNLGPRSTLYTVSGTRYSINNADQFIALNFSAGNSPDLFDLFTVNFISVKERIIFLQGQQPLNNNLFFLGGIGYEKQVFPNGLKRELAYANIGVKTRFT